MKIRKIIAAALCAVIAFSVSGLIGCSKKGWNESVLTMFRKAQFSPDKSKILPSSVANSVKEDDGLSPMSLTAAPAAYDGLSWVKRTDLANSAYCPNQSMADVTDLVIKVAEDVKTATLDAIAALTEQDKWLPCSGSILHLPSGRLQGIYGKYVSAEKTLYTDYRYADGSYALMSVCVNEEADYVEIYLNFQPSETYCKGDEEYYEYYPYIKNERDTKVSYAVYNLINALGGGGKTVMEWHTYRSYGMSGNTFEGVSFQNQAHRVNETTPLNFTVAAHSSGNKSDYIEIEKYYTEYADKNKQPGISIGLTEISGHDYSHFRVSPPAADECCPTDFAFTAAGHYLTGVKEFGYNAADIDEKNFAYVTTLLLEDGTYADIPYEDYFYIGITEGNKLSNDVPIAQVRLTRSWSNPDTEHDCDKGLIASLNSLLPDGVTLKEPTYSTQIATAEELITSLEIYGIEDPVSNRKELTEKIIEDYFDYLFTHEEFSPRYDPAAETAD